MKANTDLYTKIVLTVIAVLLGAHLLKDVTLVEKAYAHPLPSPMGVNTDGVIDVNIVQVNGKNVGTTGMPVDVKNGQSNPIVVYPHNNFVYIWGNDYYLKTHDYLVYDQLR